MRLFVVSELIVMRFSCAIKSLTTIRTAKFVRSNVNFIAIDFILYLKYISEHSLAFRYREMFRYSGIRYGEILQNSKFPFQHIL